MTLAETYAARYAEGDKSWDSLVRLFDAAMREATNRERARCVKAIQTAHQTEWDAIGDLATHEVLGIYTEAIKVRAD